MHNPPSESSILNLDTETGQVLLEGLKVCDTWLVQRYANSKIKKFPGFPDLFHKNDQFSCYFGNLLKKNASKFIEPFSRKQYHRHGPS